MIKFAAAGDSDFDDDDYIDFEDETELSSFHADVTDIDVSRTYEKKSTVKSNCLIDGAKNSFNVVLLSDFQNALIGGNLVAIKQLIGGQLGICNVRFDSGWTPLLYASYFAHIDVVNILLENGCDVNATGSDGCTPLMSICKCTQRHNVIEVIRILIQYGANALAVDEQGKTALIFIARSGNDNATSLILEHTAKIINHKDKKGLTALDWAISKTLENTIKLLIQHGASVFNADPEDISLLSPAVKTLLNSISPICNRINGHKDSETNNAEGTFKANSIEEAMNAIDKKSCDKLDGKVIKDETQSASTTGNHNEHQEVTELTFKSEKTNVEKSIWDQPVATMQQEDDIRIDINKGLVDDHYYKYGQLELLLCGLNLTHLIPKFHEHDFKFEQLLCASPDDLIGIGVKQVGARNRILTAVKDWHTTEWKDTSLPNFSSTALTFGNLQALLRISSDHLLYVGSGLRYAKLQLKTYPQVLEPSAGSQIEGNPDEIVVAQVEKLLQVTHKLCQSLKTLHLQVNSLKNNRTKQYKQADFVHSLPPTSNYKSKLAVMSLPICASFVFCLVRFKLVKLGIF